MPLICYTPKRFRASAQTIIDQANQIIEEYVEQGFDLTLRQLYYQFVSRDLLSNTTKNYTRLGGIINDARLAGLIDWDRLVDRTRGIESPTTWKNPESIVSACANQFQFDLWKGQEYRPEVWIEKEALAGVFEGICNELRVSYLSCRGYTSQSEMWRAGQRLRDIILSGQTPVILHFGDHDPSGIDMTRDIQDRLNLFVQPAQIEVRRMALNMVQVEQYNPPPNPAKTTDARFASYETEYGEQSWELDALEPAVLMEMVQQTVYQIRDEQTWQEELTKEEEARRQLKEVASNWHTIIEDM